MGFESLFFKKDTPRTSKTADNAHELNAQGLQRRQFLKGAGALAAASALGVSGVHGAEASPFSPENAEDLVGSIRAYEARLKQLKMELARIDITEEEIWSILEGEEGIPVTDRSVLEGSEVDREGFFREGGSWPSVQIRHEGKDRIPHIRFAHQRNNEDMYLAGYSNGFFVNDALIANKHVMEHSFRCELLGGREDIGGCAVSELVTNEEGKEEIDKVQLQWDRRKASEDISGNLVHIPSIHERRGRASDGTDILSGVVFKVTEGLLTTDEKEALFGARASREYEEAFLSSYAFLTKMNDSNGDQKQNAYDLEGISGSPVFLDRDCAAGVRMPSGIEWGAIDRMSPSGEKYTIVLIHGPEVVGAMLDTVKTIISMELDEAEAPQKRALTIKVQMALYEYGDESVAIDGLYGTGTRQAVYDFQQRVFSKEMLESEVIPGTVDRATWNALFPEEQDPDKKVLWFGR